MVMRSRRAYLIPLLVDGSRVSQERALSVESHGAFWNLTDKTPFVFVKVEMASENGLQKCRVVAVGTVQDFPTCKFIVAESKNRETNDGSRF